MIDPVKSLHLFGYAVTRLAFLLVALRVGERAVSERGGAASAANWGQLADLKPAAQASNVLNGPTWRFARISADCSIVRHPRFPLHQLRCPRLAHGCASVLKGPLGERVEDDALNITPSSIRFPAERAGRSGQQYAAFCTRKRNSDNQQQVRSGQNTHMHNGGGSAALLEGNEPCGYTMSKSAHRISVAGR